MHGAPRVAALLLVMPGFPCGAQQLENAAIQPLSPEVLLLSRIKAKAAENLQRLPNYTCLQTIDRARRSPHGRRFEALDTLRLEVALVGGKELFSWPGAGRFEERGIGEIVGPGAAIGNGSFALHARSVFMSRAPTFMHIGETTLNGRRTVRYYYHVPQMLSRFLIRVGEHQALVEYHGFFWADAETLDLIRLEVDVDHIPPDLDLAETSDTMEYGRTQIGDSNFLLPQSSELVMIDLAGNANRNRTQFTGCRQYAGESKLSFVEAPPEAAAPAPPVKPISLPAGLTVGIRLQTPIQSGRSATGDPVRATVARDVTKGGGIVVPKGAMLSGRITRLEKRKGLDDYYIVGLDFSTIEFDQGRGDFRAKLQNAGLGQPTRSVGRGRGAFREEADGDTAISGDPKTGGVFVVHSSRVSLPRGHSMLWRTE